MWAARMVGRRAVAELARERDTDAPGSGGHDLMRYWTRGEGAVKIGWSEHGSMDRCKTLLAEKGVKDPGGLCATYYREVKGHWPGEDRGKHQGETVEMAADIALDPAAQETLSAEWHGILTVEGIDTGDGRYFAPNSLTWPEEHFPLPLRWQQLDVGEHKQSVRVGNIERIERRPVAGVPDVFEIWGHGTFDVEDEHGVKIRNKMGRGYASGNSVDVDSISNANVELVFAEGGDVETTIFHKGRIRATTLVDIPAFVEAKLHLGAEQRAEMYGLVASGTIGCPDLLIFLGPDPTPTPAVLVAAAVPGVWDPSVPFASLTADASDGVLVAAGRAAEFFAYTPPALPDGTVNVGECRYLHHAATANGEPGLPNLTACAASIHALNSRPGRLSRLEARSAYEHLAAHIRAAGVTPPDFAPAEVPEVVVAAAIELADAPQAAWFDDPRLDGPTGLTVTDDGRVFGHAAAWGSCHTGFGDACVNPPEELSHDYYRLGEVLCAGGERVAVGQITLGTGHAPTSGMSWRGAMEHYDNTGSVVADVATGNDAYGIWVAGALRPGVTAGQVRELMGAKLSGDWRKIAGQLRLVAFLAVNVPGFPVPRVKAGVFAGEQLSLTAAGVLAVQEPAVLEEAAVDDPAVVAAGAVGVDGGEASAARLALQRRLGRDPETLRAALAARLSTTTGV